MHDPCNFSPSERHARRIARFFAGMFPPSSLVLDIGFGQGYFLEEAAKRGYRAIGIDRDPKLVADAKARRLNAIEADVRDVPKVITEPIDGVIGAHIIEHLPPDDVEALLHHTASVTRRGGCAIFVTPDPRDFRGSLNGSGTIRHTSGPTPPERCDN